MSCRYIKAYKYAISGRTDLGKYLLRRLKKTGIVGQNPTRKNMYVVFSIFVYFYVRNQFKVLDVNLNQNR